MPVPHDPDESEVELSEEVEGSTPAEPTAVGPSDSGLDLRYSGEAPEGQDEYEADSPPVSRDLSGFAEDAGDEASYGFESASETSRYSSREFQEVQEELTEDANLNDSGEYTSPFEKMPPDASDLADAAPSSDSSEALAWGASDSSDELRAADEAPSEEPAVEEVAGFTVEEEPEPPPARGTGRVSKPAPASAPSDDDRGSRPGQIAKNALDDIFSRAAKLKKQDPK